MDIDQYYVVEEEMLDYWERFNSLYEDVDPQEYLRILNEIVSRRENIGGPDIEKILPSHDTGLYRNNYLKSMHWRVIREVKLRAANGACEDCGQYASEVHHKHYMFLGSESINDLVALCSSCHRLRHRK